MNNGHDRTAVQRSHPVKGNPAQPRKATAKRQTPLGLVGRLLARYLSKPREAGTRPATSPPHVLERTIRKGDVLLVEGNSRFSSAIKYLTQSTWSHATICVVDRSVGEPMLLEADVLEGVRLVPLREYATLHTRICRPVGLNSQEIDNLVTFVLAALGHQYDLRHIIDLLRYLIRTPPVPARWRRRLLALGSGDPTRAICSSLVAQAFQNIQYPILPEIIVVSSEDPSCTECYREQMHIRHHSLFVPRDFDISPYFQIVKPTLSDGFDFHKLSWSGDGTRHHNHETTMIGRKPLGA